MHDCFSLAPVNYGIHTNSPVSIQAFVRQGVVDCSNRLLLCNCACVTNITSVLVLFSGVLSFDVQQVKCDWQVNNGKTKRGFFFGYVLLLNLRFLTTKPLTLIFKLGFEEFESFIALHFI